MSKPVKNLMTQVYQQWFQGLNGAVLVNLRGNPATDTNRLRADLANKNIQVTVVKNSLAKRAFAGSDQLEPLGEYLDGPCAMVYPVSDDASVISAARELIDWAKEMPSMEFRGAVLEGIRFGPDQIEELSKYPTRDEAQAKVVQLLLSPAQNLASQVTSPGKDVAGLVDAIREKLENGEEIKKAS
jgi:large subunit ribosomal protein L10